MRHYYRDPWGIVADDRRHAQYCMRLQSLINIKLRLPGKIDGAEFFVSKFDEEYKKMQTLLYSRINVPWLDEGQTSEDLALEGQVRLNKIKTKYKL